MTELRRTTTQLTQQLTQELHGICAPSVARAALTGAMRDLRGSISPDALPEMAFRLACFRVTSAAPRDAATPARVDIPVAKPA
jgi:hypothetical protein